MEIQNISYLTHQSLNSYNQVLEAFQHQKQGKKLCLTNSALADQ
jgi:hypothetical protein